MGDYFWGVRPQIFFLNLDSCRKFPDKKMKGVDRKLVELQGLLTVRFFLFEHGTELIRSALESSDLGPFNDGSNVRIRPLGADLITFEMSELPKKKVFCQHFRQFQTQLNGNLAISNLTRSAPSDPIPTFGPPLNAPRSVLSSAC